MALVELTSELAIGAGTSVGSPEGRHIAGPDLGVTNVIPNIDATGFTLDVSSLPTQFTLANLPQIGMMEAFGKEGVDVSVMSNPPLKEGVDVSVMSNPPLKEAVITITPQEFTVRGYTVTGDRANRNIGGTDTEEFSTKRLSNFNIEKGQYDKLPYRDNNVIGFDQPFILKDIGDKWGPGGLGAVDEGLFRGGFVTSAARTVADVFRLGKFILTPRGIMFGLKQAGLQLLNPRTETRIWNPLSLGSVAPMVHVDRHWDSGTYEEAIDKDGWESDGFGSILDGYADAVISPVPSVGLLFTTGRRATLAHAVAMVPSRGGKMALPGIPELKWSDFPVGNIDSLSKNIVGENKYRAKGEYDLNFFELGNKEYTTTDGTSIIPARNPEAGFKSGILGGRYAGSQLTQMFLTEDGLFPSKALTDIDWKLPLEKVAHGKYVPEDETKLRQHRYDSLDADIQAGEALSGHTDGLAEQKEKKHEAKLSSGGNQITIDGSEYQEKHWNEKLSNIETTTDALSSRKKIHPTHRWFEKVPDKDSKEIVPSIDEWEHQTDDSSTRAKLIDRYSTLSYGHLNGNHAYLNLEKDTILSAGEQNKEGSVGTVQPLNADDVATELKEKRDMAKNAHKGIGGWTNRHHDGIKIRVDKDLGLIKTTDTGKFDTDLTDKANLHPYGSEEYDDDFIPFKFKDVVNNKFIIFRAILGGISDSISPDWSDERFIGRPDKVFVYKGADRTISFDFNVYPKTKQELPVLWDKLNYLVGLCYPAWNTNRMVAPFVELSLGDMYKSTPGFLASLSIASQESTTWELDKGLRVPKYLTCSCSFRYIGKYRPSMIGKHFDFDWIRSDHDFDSFIKDPATTTDMTSPDRTKYKGLFPISPNPATENSTPGADQQNELAQK